MLPVRKPKEATTTTVAVTVAVTTEEDINQENLYENTVCSL
jgi:hypothetical protein